MATVFSVRKLIFCKRESILTPMRKVRSFVQQGIRIASAPAILLLFELLKIS